MKKIILSATIALALTSINASEYIATLDDKHYKIGVVVQPFEEKTTPENGGESPYSSGQFIETDWISANDKRVLLDTTTGYEWLDLRETTNTGTNGLPNRLSTDLAGWRRATEAEIVEMMANYTGITSPYTLHTVVDSSLEVKIDQFLSYMGIHLTDSYGQYTYGTYINGSGLLKNAGFVNYFSTNTYYLRQDLSTSSSQSTGVGDTYGIWLVSEGGTTYSSINNPSINTPSN
jgi:hypothetical protein